MMLDVVDQKRCFAYFWPRSDHQRVLISDLMDRDCPSAEQRSMQGEAVLADVSVFSMETAYEIHVIATLESNV